VPFVVVPLDGVAAVGAGRASATSVPLSSRRTLAVPLHAAQDGLPHPEPVLGDVVELEPRAVVADERLDPRRADLDVGRHGWRAVPDRVQEGLPHGPHERLPTVVEVAVTRDDQLDGRAVDVLDLVRDLSHRGGEGGVGTGRAGIQPRAQLALLGAGELRHRRRVVGLALDEGERLEHRVVQVGRDVGALGGPGELGLLAAQVRPEAQAPGSRDQHHAGEDGQGGESDVPDGGQGTPPRHHDDQADQRQQAAEREPRSAEPPCARGGPEPAATLGVIELRPGDHGADRHHEQGDEETEPEVEPGVLDDDEQPYDDEDAADEEHARRVAGLAVRGAVDVCGRGLHAQTRARGARRVDRHPAVLALDGAVDRLRRQRPEEEIGDDAGPAGERQHDEADPDQAQVPPEVLRQPGTHTAHDAPFHRAVEDGPGSRLRGLEGCSPLRPLVGGRHAHILSHPRGDHECIQGRSALLQGRVRGDPHGEGRLLEGSMSAMTQNPGQTAGSPPQHLSGLDRFFGWLRSIDVRRDTEDKWLAGVCSGIAHRLGVDPLVIRAGLIVLILLGGIGVTLYLIAWAFLPNTQEEIVAEKAVRGGDVGGILLLALVVLSLVGGSGLVDGGGWGIWWLWWVAIPVGLVVWLVTRNREPGQAVVPSGQTPPYAAAPYAAAPAPGAPGAPPAGPAPAAPIAPRGTAAALPPGQAPSGPVPPGMTAGPSGPGGPSGPPVAPYQPYQPPRPPAPPRPRHRSAGFLAAVIVSGLGLAAYGLTAWGHAELGWSGDQHVTSLAVALGVVALSVVGMGLAGFRSGLTGFLAVLLAVTTWFASIVPSVNIGGGIGDREWRPTGSQTSESFELGVGSANLHLGSYPTSPTTPGRIDARVGVGELRILVPDDLTVEVRSDVNVGEITEAGGWGLDENNQWTQNGQGGRNLSSTEVIGTGPTDVVVHARVGLGQIIIGKE
jgi:phage shock protein PspC (stress-responsive transcriptional regulator)